LGPERESVLEQLPKGPTPEVLVAAYLAWGFQAAREGLRAIFDAHTLRLNLAAPMSHVQDDRLRDVYLHIVQAAWYTALSECSMQVNQGIAVDTLVPRLKEYMGTHLVDETERHFAVLPETLAPIVSMSRDPRLAPGIYLIVDMGGGTTEFSVNKVLKSKNAQYVHCYCDDLIHLGGLDFTALDSLSHTEADVRKAHLLNQTSNEMKKVWYGGYSKEKEGGPARRAQWKKLQVLLVGGGTRRAEVVEQIRSVSPQRAIFQVEGFEYGVDRYEPADIDMDGLDRSQGLDLSLLGVAHGLALEVQRWPEFLKPVEITAAEGLPRKVFPEAYWYVGGK
jgi:hypothetical protein